MSGWPSPFKSVTTIAADAFVSGNGINPKTRVRRQFVDFEFAQRTRCGRLVLPVSIVEQVDFRAQIVGHNQIVQAVAVQIRRVQQADAVVNRINFRAGEIEGVRNASGVNNGNKAEKKY